jgi:hypothetical protein
MTDSSGNPDAPPQSERLTEQREFGYAKPPKHAQFKEGRSGNPGGRPKSPIGISIKELLDGDQRGKNGEVISRREAYVIAIVKEAMRCNPKAFSRFMILMNRSGLMRRETSTTPSVVSVPSITPTPEELEDWQKNNFGLPGKRSTK